MGDGGTTTSIRFERPGQWRSVAARVTRAVFATILVGITLFGAWVSLGAIMLKRWDDGAPPGSRPPDYWFAILPWVVSPVGVLVTLFLMYRIARYRVLVLVAGYALVIINQEVFNQLLVSAPTWVYP